jgi:hypothetical protein
MDTTFTTGLMVEKRVSTTSSCYAGTIITWCTTADSVARRQATEKLYFGMGDKNHYRNGLCCLQSVILTLMNGWIASSLKIARGLTAVTLSGMRASEWTGI